MRRKPSPSPFDDSAAMEKAPGISNRESASEESAERAAHPPLDTGPPPPMDAAGRTGEPTDDQRDLQTSRKVGSRSTAQKETGSRYPDRATPASKKVPGAFGKEPNDETRQTESAATMRDAVRPPELTESRMQRIAARAHEIYQARGGQDGKALEDWLAAERQIDHEIDR
jgi:Protein of unknown function (DUF2934)